MASAPKAATSVVEQEHDGTLVAAPVELDKETRGIIGEMVATANKHPRSVKRFLEEARGLVTLDEDTAEACMYALPRDGKTIEGPSARFAEIVAYCWRNLRIDAKVVGDDGRLLTARGGAWDMERNVLISYEVSRRVVKSNGKRYSDDMVTQTGNAASSIALRNAVLKVIPAGLWKPLYHAAKEVAVGTTETLVVRRTKMLNYFQKLGAAPPRVFELLGIQGEADMTLEHLGVLRGLATAIREGDTTLDEAFESAAKGTGVTQPKRASDSQATTSKAPESKAPERKVDRPPASAAPSALTVINIRALQSSDKKRRWWEVELSNKAIYWTDDTTVGQAAVDAKAAGSAIAEVKTHGETRRWKGMESLAGLVLQREPGQEG